MLGKFDRSWEPGRLQGERGKPGNSYEKSARRPTWESSEQTFKGNRHKKVGVEKEGKTNSLPGRNRNKTIGRPRGKNRSAKNELAPTKIRGREGACREVKRIKGP